jgi:hypothetical protein
MTLPKSMQIEATRRRGRLLDGVSPPIAWISEEKAPEIAAPPSSADEKGATSGEGAPFAMRGCCCV